MDAWTGSGTASRIVDYGHRSYTVGVFLQANFGSREELTLAGLAHLSGLGLPAVLLYVDESNTAAVRMYEGLGFTRWSTDVMYQHSR